MGGIKNFFKNIKAHKERAREKELEHLEKRAEYEERKSLAQVKIGKAKEKAGKFQGKEFGNGMFGLQGQFRMPSDDEILWGKRPKKQSGGKNGKSKI